MERAGKEPKHMDARMMSCGQLQLRIDASEKRLTKQRFDVGLVPVLGGKC
jgi:hypothetical protein